jgi:hypothetical protein
MTMREARRLVREQAVAYLKIAQEREASWVYLNFNVPPSCSPQPHSYADKARIAQAINEFATGRSR